jgi:uncharacterized protein
MRLIIYIGHPADFHLFKNIAALLQKKGWEVSILTRNKDITLELLAKSGFSYHSLGDAPKTLTGKIIALFLLNIKVFNYLRCKKPDLAFSHGSVHLSQMSWLLGIPHISVEDTGNMEQILLYRPFSRVILTPDSFQKNLGKKQIFYPGNHELAYLHPDQFKPDYSILSSLGMKPGEPYVIVRFVAWNASHDTGHYGISMENKIKAVKSFAQYARVFISSEVPLPAALEPNRLTTPVERIHDVIAFSSLMYGESASMASEAAVLGVPAIYLDNTGRCYTREEEEKYNLVYNYSESEEDQEKSIAKGIELLSTETVKKDWQVKRLRMLKDKVDVTAFLCWFLEDWPGSMQKVRSMPPGSFHDETAPWINHESLSV